MWRAQPDEKGLARTCQRQRGLDLVWTRLVVAHIRPCKEGWYWYTINLEPRYNSKADGEVFKSMENAKDHCEGYMGQFFKEAKRQRGKE